MIPPIQINVTALPKLNKRVTVAKLDDLKQLALTFRKPILYIEDWVTEHMGIKEEVGKNWKAWHIIDGDLDYVYYEKKKEEAKKNERK